MRRIDVITVSLAIFVGGGLLYIVFQAIGLDGLSAGVWSQALLVIVVLAWTSSYLFRVANKDMTYNQQLKDYEDAVLQKRLEEMTPEELEKLQQEIEQEE
ncbi:DUF3007 family protein [Crocosphaera watsonii WH 8501]|uniref:DUF3007 family protein n=6 Tax=Crocosphaera watsonii TaxID=263511 RepID=Q4BVD6_CROWT|nr:MULTISPECIES: DUF3007 family protein [Crocosphaera]EAM47865.1 hypothetical protein CwatDRAFT_0506 [Crocosphaera watsonii WH 8501]EHJ09754.1 hypothetical protein CWATWH0003_5479 [Crocosphaera watsonii WH 0003]MCH2247138.1 DUF3007 family protein [Crocosphaera sp.]NQZ62098.1 DUF3007 family protein [Crocosphaera sp.]CCQ49772.1 hypothetical protein CWATWH8502_3621 [Crocosphaera watsonii WH 8502]